MQRGAHERTDLSSGRLIEGAQSVQRDFIHGSSGYGAILADPPWQMKMRSEKGMGRSPDGPAPLTRNQSRQNNPERHYATMPLQDIMALPVGELAGSDCVLFLWAVDPMLPQAIEVGRAWGSAFDLIWHKLFPMGTGYWTRANPEICLLFTRGQPKRLSAAVRKLIVAPRREHSRKPESVRHSIQQLVAGPYLELFAREPAPGWDSWGNQTERFAEAA